MQLSPQQARIISELEKGPLTTADFMNKHHCPKCGFQGKGLNMVNFSQRITELKRLGYNIVSKPIRSNLWEYRLVQVREIKIDWASDGKPFKTEWVDVDEDTVDHIVPSINLLPERKLL